MLMLKVKGRQILAFQKKKGNRRSLDCKIVIVVIYISEAFFFSLHLLFKILCGIIQQCYLNLKLDFRSITRCDTKLFVHMVVCVRVRV